MQFQPANFNSFGQHSMMLTGSGDEIMIYRNSLENNDEDELELNAGLEGDIQDVCDEADEETGYNKEVQTTEELEKEWQDLKKMKASKEMKKKRNAEEENDGEKEEKEKKGNAKDET